MNAQKLGLIIALLAQTALFAACATNEGEYATFTIPGSGSPQYASSNSSSTSSGTDSSKAIPKAEQVKSVSAPEMSRGSDGAMMKHNLRQIVEYDTYKMTKLVNREINMKEDSTDAFLDQVAATLGQTVFLQPHFTEREVALRELKGKVDQEEYVIVLEKAADSLMSILKSSGAASDQAGATIALTNLVVEVKALKRPELKGILQKIAVARLKVSDDAKRYAVQSMQGLISPSQEAETALKAL
jgi:hypothetical protein